jgi:hypothetical protein
VEVILIRGEINDITDDVWVFVGDTGYQPRVALVISSILWAGYVRFLLSFQRADNESKRGNCVERSEPVKDLPMNPQLHIVGSATGRSSVKDVTLEKVVAELGWAAGGKKFRALCWPSVDMQRATFGLTSSLENALFSTVKHVAIPG